MVLTRGQHGATAKYSTSLSHVLNVYSIAPAPDAVEPNSDYANSSSYDDDTAASDANSATVPEPPCASMLSSKIHWPSSLLAVDASVRALRDVVQGLVTSQTKLQQEVLRAQREAEARHQAECDQLRKGLRDAEALLAEVAALRAHGPTTVSTTAPPPPTRQPYPLANPPPLPPVLTSPSPSHLPLAPQPPCGVMLPNTPNSHQRLPAPVPNSLRARSEEFKLHPCLKFFAAYANQVLWCSGITFASHAKGHEIETR